jgi:hypothetical protein
VKKLWRFVRNLLLCLPTLEASSSLHRETPEMELGARPDVTGKREPSPKQQAHKEGPGGGDRKNERQESSDECPTASTTGKTGVGRP